MSAADILRKLSDQPTRIHRWALTPDYCQQQIMAIVKVENTGMIAIRRIVITDYQNTAWIEYATIKSEKEVNHWINYYICELISFKYTPIFRDSSKSKTGN